ncbi:MAG: amidohydrolase family protein [Candidatus Acidiferrum sp.]|jgi:L-fuconolactonase
MNIDAHQHFWTYDSSRHDWITEPMAVLKRDFLPAELAVQLDANDIHASIAVQADQSEMETLFLLELAKHSERIAGVVGWIDLLSPQLEERLQFFSQFKKLCGFRHIVQSEPDDRFLLRPDFTRGISCLRGFGFTYDILIYPKQLPAAIEMVAKFPEQRFVVDHVAKPEMKAKNVALWATQISSIARHSNVCCKLSGLVTEADWHHWTPADFDPYLDVVFESFGAERLMFGSDWPVCLLAASYTQVKQIIESYVNRKAPAARENIFGANAIRFYDLKAHADGLAA